MIPSPKRRKVHAGAYALLTGPLIEELKAGDTYPLYILMEDMPNDASDGDLWLPAIELKHGMIALGIYGNDGATIPASAGSAPDKEQWLFDSNLMGLERIHCMASFEKAYAVPIANLRTKVTVEIRCGVLVWGEEED